MTLFRSHGGSCRQGGWLIVAMALAAPACSPVVNTHGYRLDERVVAQIRPGTSSREEVFDLLGSPSTRTTMDNSTWYYVSQTRERFTFYQEKVVAQEVLAITFDDLGAVQEIARHDLNGATEVAFVDRETPTMGNELTIWEQFVGNIGRFNPTGDVGGGGP